ncbi:MAG: T9SS type A sorting domain-containing protein [Chlorobi bacterium]|nr:T9SS type A sorting domain-containing protein [Chlorobiota bacterium]
MKKVIFTILFLTTISAFAQTSPPDAPITPKEWLRNMNYGSWWLFTPPNEGDNWIYTDNYSPRILDSLQAMGINGGRLHWQAADDFDETLHIPQYIIDFYDEIIDDMMERKMSVCLQVHFTETDMTEEVKQRTFNGWRQVCEAFQNKSHYLAMSPVIEFHGWGNYYIVDGDTVWSTDPEYDSDVRQDSLNWLYDTLTVIFRETNPDRIISYKPWGAASRGEFETLDFPFGNDPGPHSGEPVYYIASMSGSYGMGEWFKWSPDMHPDTLKMIKEQTMRSGLTNITKDVGVHHAINYRDTSGIEFWIDHWDPAYWKRYFNDDGTVASDSEHWTIDQNIAYIEFFMDTLKSIGTAGAGMQTSKFWNDNSDDLIRLGDSFFKGIAEFDTMSVEMMNLLRSKVDDGTYVLKINNSPDIKVYPNPASSFIQIEKPENITAELYSIAGLKLADISNGIQQLNFPVGTYIIVFRNRQNEVVHTRKLIVH